MNFQYRMTLAAVCLLAAGLACNVLGGGPAPAAPGSDGTEAASIPTGAQDAGADDATQPDFVSFVDPMTLTTPTSGGGIRPVLAWEPVEAADRYGVYLYAPDGSLYWSWQGRETSVPVGGRPQLREDATGPSVIEGMSWVVIAYNQEQLPIASAGPRPIGP